MKNIFKLLSSFILVFFLISSVNAVNIMLQNQNPDPVAPGNFVYINIQIANEGSISINKAKIRLVENEIFSIAKGSDVEKELGVIPGYTGEASNNFIISKFKVKVDDDAPLGLNSLVFELDTSSGTYEEEIEILIQEDNPKIQITEFNINTLEAGKGANLEINLENINKVDLENVIVSLDLEEVEGDVLSVKSGSNEKLILNLPSKSSKKINFDLVASPDAQSRPYTIPVDITFEDSLGNNYESRVLGSVNIYSEPILSVNIDSQEIYSKGKGRITFAVANPGTSTIKGTQVEILDSENYEVIEGKFEYVGDLNPDDFQTIQAQIYLNSEEDFNINVKVKYLDSYNKVNEEIIALPVKIYSESELTKLGLSGGSSDSGFGVGTTITMIVVLIIGFFIGRKLKFRKSKKN